MSTVFADRDAIADLRQALFRFAARAEAELPVIDAAIERAFSALQQAEDKQRKRIASLAIGLALQLPDFLDMAETGIELWQAESWLGEVAETAEFSSAPDIFSAIRTLTGFVPLVAGAAQVYGLWEATHKLAAIEQMRQRLDAESDSYRPAAHRFRHILDNDLPNACAYLERRFTTLDDFLHTRLAVASDNPTPTRPGPGVFMPVEAREGGSGGPERRG